MVRIHALGKQILRSYKIDTQSLPKPITSLIARYRYGEDGHLPPSPLLLRSLRTLLNRYNIPHSYISHDIEDTPKGNDYYNLLPSTYLERLLPHQRAIIESVIRAERYLIADDVGMGKTITSLAAVNACALGDPHFTRLCIVTLKNLIPQWWNAVEAWLLPEVLERLDIVIINYEQLRLQRNDWLSTSFTKQALILDEAHFIKNRKAARSQAVAAIAHEVRYLWLLTGTPLERAPDDYWHLLHIIAFKKFTSYWAFREAFTAVQKNPYTGYETVVGAKLEPILHDIVTPHYVRRTRQVLALREPQIIDVPILLEGKHLKEYSHLEETVWDEVRDKPIVNAVSRMVFLRQCAIHPSRSYSSDYTLGKFPTLLDLVSGLDNHKFVIFSSFKWAAAMAAEALKEHCNIVHFQAGDKEIGLNKFKEDKSVQGLVSTVQALGIGHNLQVASVVILLDLPMSRTQYTQTLGRVVRIGQLQDTLVYHLVMQRTIDTHIARLLKSKEKTFNAALVVSNWLEEKNLEHIF